MSAVATPARQASGGMSTKTLNRVVIYGLLALFALFYLMPLFVMLVTSFKTMDEIQNGNMLALPKAPTFLSSRKVFAKATPGSRLIHHLVNTRAYRRCSVERGRTKTRPTRQRSDTTAPGVLPTKLGLSCSASTCRSATCRF